MKKGVPYITRSAEAKCKDCGKKFAAIRSNSKYCNDCKVKRMG